MPINRSISHSYIQAITKKFQLNFVSFVSNSGEIVFNQLNTLFILLKQFENLLYYLIH